MLGLLLGIQAVGTLFFLCVNRFAEGIQPVSHPGFLFPNLLFCEGGFSGSR